MSSKFDSESVRDDEVKVEVESIDSMEKVGEPRPDLNGLRVKLPGNPTIYLIDKGYRRAIPNLETLRMVFRDDHYVEDLNINEIPIGRPISNQACLAKATDGSATIYLVDNGVKRGIASLAIFDKYRFSGNRIFMVPRSIIEAIRDGEVISS